MYFQYVTLEISSEIPNFIIVTLRIWFKKVEQLLQYEIVLYFVQ